MLRTSCGGRKKKMKHSQTIRKAKGEKKLLIDKGGIWGYFGGGKEGGKLVILKEYSSRKEGKLTIR